MLKFKRTIASFITASVVLLSLTAPALATVGMSESESNDSAATATVIPSNYDLTQEISGSIGSAGDVDYYKFVPSNSGGYSIATLGTTDTFGCLYDSNLNALDVSDDQTYPTGTNCELRYELTAGSIYFIKINHTNTTDTGNYTLKITPVNYKYNELESNNSFETAIYANVNSIASAEIGIAGDEDYYKVELSGNTTLAFEALGDLDTYGYLYDCNYNLITSDDDLGEGNNMKIVANLAGQQRYYLRVRHYSSTNTGNYSLKITTVASSTDSEANNFSSAVQLNTENYVTQSGFGINSSGDVDFFKFVPQVDGIYTFKSTGLTDVYGEVYDSSQTLIKGDDNSNANGNFMISLPLTANQTYHLKVSGPNGTTGNYGLDIAKGQYLTVPQYLQLPYDQLCWATASAMAISYFNNDTINRTLDIAKSRSNSQYPCVFNKPGYLYEGVVYGTDIYTNTSINFNTVINEDSSGHPKDVNSYCYTTNELFKSIDNGYPIIVTVPNGAGGNHVVIIKGYKIDGNGLQYIYNDPLDGQEHMSTDLGTLSYVTFYPQYADLEPNNTIADAGRLDTNQPVEGSIGKSGDVDFYKFPFSNSANQQCILETTGTTDTYGEVYDNNGILVASSDNGGQGSNFKIQFTATAYKTYYVKVSHNGSGTGSYTLNYSYN